MTSQNNDPCKGCYYYDRYSNSCNKFSKHFYEPKTQEPICFVDPRSK